jgi:hypothetical protein
MELYNIYDSIETLNLMHKNQNNPVMIVDIQIEGFKDHWEQELQQEILQSSRKKKHCRKK